MPLVEKNTTPTGMIICEHEKNEELPAEICNFHLKKQYRYGKIMLSVYKTPDEEGIDSHEDSRVSGEF